MQACKRANDAFARKHGRTHKHLTIHNAPVGEIHAFKLLAQSMGIPQNELFGVLLAYFMEHNTAAAERMRKVDLEVTVRYKEPEPELEIRDPNLDRMLARFRKGLKDGSLAKDSNLPAKLNLLLEKARDKRLPYGQRKNITEVIRAIEEAV